MGAETILNLQGFWVCLEPVTEQIQGIIDILDYKSSLVPQMGGGVTQNAIQESPCPPLAIRLLMTGTICGILTSRPLDGYEGVSVVSFLAEKNDTMPHYSLEACRIYIDYLFLSGTRIVHMEVLEFNTSVHGLLRRCGFPIHARTRQSCYVAGSFWDTLLFGITREEWKAAQGIYQAYISRCSKVQLASQQGKVREKLYSEGSSLLL